MGISLLMLSVFVACFNLIMTFKIIQNQQNHKRQMKIRKAITEISPLVFEMEIVIKDGTIQNYPSMRKQFEQFVLFYDSFSEEDLDKGVMKSLGLKWRSILAIIERGKKTEGDFEIVKAEMLEISNKRILELYANQLYFMNYVMFVATPNKYKLYLLAFHLKKNPLVQNLSEFEISSLKVSNTKKDKVKIANISNFTHNGFSSALQQRIA